MELPCEILWIPIADTDLWNQYLERRFETLQVPMPWYSVHHPLIINEVTKKFTQQDWKFNGETPVLVLLDPFGKNVCDNAIQMMWIWGSSAFPFTASKELQLWSGESWTLELQLILSWIKEEMAYVGKSSNSTRVEQTINKITSKKLSYSWNQTTVWFFWKRIQSMLHSKIQLGQVDNTNPIAREIKRLLTYDKHSGWALIVKGSRVLIIGDYYSVLTTLIRYESWKDNIPHKGLDEALIEYALKIQRMQTNCSAIDFGSGSVVPNGFSCPECHREMSKFVAFKCCHDKGVLQEKKQIRGKY